MYDGCSIYKHKPLRNKHNTKGHGVREDGWRIGVCSAIRLPLLRKQESYEGRGDEDSGVGVL